MKTLTLALWITVSALAGCGVTDPDQATGATEADEVTEAASSEVPSLQQLLPGANTPPSFGCSRPAVCLTAFQCHHQEGTNLGVLNCASGTTCCVF